MFNNIPLNQIYTNINELSIICLIKKNLTKQIGIYSIVNNNDGKMYIGSSMNLAKRILEHINNKQSNIYLQNAISKYKLENFTLYNLEFLYTDNNLSKTELNIQLIEMEQKYLDLFDNKYNINPTAGKSRIGAKHTEATRELMSKVRQENP
uniref:GIY-YIG domain-containing protein n=2 Tax=Epichloe TaxID=5112 RepID=A0A1J0D0E4_EPINE|nr:hypothetical protein [Epichloe festucae]APB96825.1 hypothetical protein [Epichloe festucae]APB96885.1 hypothetical protein [Epichloe hybrida]